METQIRSILKEDLTELKKILDSIDLFPSFMLDEMISDYFSNSESKEIWFTALQNNKPVGLAYCAPEKLTEGTYNLYAIGIQKNLQGLGIGSLMMNYLEQELIKRKSRILIVETSGSEDYHLTRKFYTKLDYSTEAIIREFWAKGDDKVIFWKKLN